MLKTLNVDSLFNTRITVTKEVKLADILPDGLLVLKLKDGTIVVYEDNLIDEIAIKKYKTESKLVEEEGVDLDEEVEITAENDWDNIYTIITAAFEEAENYNLDKIYFFPA